MFELPPSADLGTDVPADAPTPDPYDGVALGVECAWPLQAADGSTS